MPKACKSCTTWAASGRTHSSSSKAAKGRTAGAKAMPSGSLCSSDKYTAWVSVGGQFPAAAKANEPSRTQRGWPCQWAEDCTWARKPCPASSCNCSTCQACSSSPTLKLCSALDTGCIDCFAKATANSEYSAGSASPFAAWLACTANPSCVRVPVLSKTIVCTLAKASNPCRLRTNTPCRAKEPAAVKMATGVAKDRAQGQVTMSTTAAYN